MFAQPALASESAVHKSETLTARLLTAENGVRAGAKTVSAALHLKLEDGWKTYWRSPGEVGIPPQIDWSGSANVNDVEFLWPAPTRFRAFGIENFGYSKAVAFPLKITLADPGAPLTLKANVNLLVCSDICVPESFELTLALDRGSGIDPEAASIIAAFSKRVPESADRTGIRFEGGAISADGKQLVVALHSTTPFGKPDVFPEMGQSSFGASDIRLGDERRRLWASFPVLGEAEEGAELKLTVVDGNRAATFPAALGGQTPEPPYTVEAAAFDPSRLAWIALLAVLGGFILNLMPCVLPVLSIKLGAAIKGGARPDRQLRAGFLLSAAGVMSFIWFLAAATILAKTLGLSVGWGLQFQNPFFLIAMIAVLVLFAANLFGMFDFALPDALTQRLAAGTSRKGYFGDFATGAFAAMLATPCSAPFLGTAIAFALAGQPLDILVIFTALGLGLALPYFSVAAMPGLVRLLPKPGPWMIWFKSLLGLLLAATAAWLVWVLTAVASPVTALTATGLLFAALLLLGPWAAFASRRLRSGLTGSMILAALMAPLAFSDSATDTVPLATPAQDSIPWQRFERTAIPRLISEGKIVFVDVTADWCITCKANKSLVIERGDVARAAVIARRCSDDRRLDQAQRRNYPLSGTAWTLRHPLQCRLRTKTA
jgi:suppressor for copper-sensitivity B